MADTPIPAGTPAPAAPSTDANSQAQSSAAPADAAAQAAQQTLASPNATPAQKVAAAKRLKSLKIKVDGQEYEERLPFDIDDTKENREWLTRQLQFSKVSQKRMGEKAELENEVRQFLNELQKNPTKLLSDPRYGVDVKKLAAQVIEQEIANAAKSPDQLAREKIENELQQLKEQREREKNEYEKREFERIQQVEYERYDASITSAIESSDLPKSPYVVKKMADLMMVGLKEGLDVTPEDVLPLVREEILEDIRQMAQAMPLETIEKLFGGDILTKIRKKNVSRAKQTPTPGSPKLPDVGATKASGEKKDETQKKMTLKQMFGV